MVIFLKLNLKVFCKMFFSCEVNQGTYGHFLNLYLMFLIINYLYLWIPGYLFTIFKNLFCQIYFKILNPAGEQGTYGRFKNIIINILNVKFT